MTNQPSANSTPLPTPPATRFLTLEQASEITGMSSNTILHDAYLQIFPGPFRQPKDEADEIQFIEKEVHDWLRRYSPTSPGNSPLNGKSFTPQESEMRANQIKFRQYKARSRDYAKRMKYFV